MTRLKSLAAMEKCPLRRVAAVITGHGNPCLDNCLCLRLRQPPKVASPMWVQFLFNC